MKNDLGEVLYVGKAKNLKNRVASYFQKSAKSPKTQVLVEQIQDFEFILTQNELESLVLENNLIKKHRPKYNIRLRDDKTYPYLEIDTDHDFPLLKVTRRPSRKKTVKLFGPFPESFRLKMTVEVLKKVFKLRDCQDYDFKTRKKPCLLYEMNQCSAPCVAKINQTDYQKDMQWAIDFFGPQKNKKVLKEIEKMMQAAASDEKYERALILRDALEQLQDYQEGLAQQKVEILDEQDVNIDLLGWSYSQDLEIEVCLYMIRNSMLVGNKSFSILAYQEQDIALEVLACLWEYYQKQSHRVEKLIWPKAPDEARLLTDLNIKLQLQPRKYAKLCQLAQDLAEENLKIKKEENSLYTKGLKDLAQILKLRKQPRVLECFDVAVWQGHSPTASQIVFRDGQPLKQAYRYYHLQTRPEGNNDFAMLAEALSRRLQAGQLPDLFVVDGGKLQLKVFEKVLAQAQVDLPAVGIAKARAEKEERLIISQYSEGLTLKKYPHLMKILTHMRDEAHRFSRRLHHQAELKKFIPQGQKSSKK